MKKYLYEAFMLALLIIVPALLQAQIPQTADSTSIYKLSRDMEISVSRSVLLIDAMRTNQKEISSLLKNTNLNPGERQKQLIVLIQQREQKVFALLNDPERAKFKRLMQNTLGERRIEVRKNIAVLRQQQAKYDFHVDSTRINP